jgi:uncharacterized protein (TIGR01244 family)
MRSTLSMIAVASLLNVAAAGAQFTKPAPIAKLPAPAIHDTAGMFLARFASVGDDVFIGGQPTERALRDMKARGVTTVINLRMPDEMRRIPFDEAALIAQLGMKYVHIPVRDGTANPYSPATLKAFTDALKAADGKVLLHCTIAWRASHLWAAYLIQERGVPVDTALAHARAINLMDEHRMSSSGMQPVEEFLGRRLPSLGRPR